MAKYKIYCEDCSRELNIESLIIQEKCIENPAHIITPGSLLILAGENPKYGKDYKTLRDELMAYVIGILGVGGTLSEIEAESAARNFCLPGEMRETIFPGDNHFKIAETFIKHMTVARQNRYDRAGAVSIVRLTLEQSFELGNDLATGNLASNFLSLGIEGKIDGDPIDGIYDYITSYSGSVYSGTGLLSKNWTPIGCTLVEFSNTVVGILRENS